MRDGARSGPVGLERSYPGAVDAPDASLITAEALGLGDALRLTLATRIGRSRGWDGLALVLRACTGQVRAEDVTRVATLSLNGQANGLTAVVPA
jgi:hypothetical protein